MTLLWIAVVLYLQILGACLACGCVLGAVTWTLQHYIEWRDFPSARVV